MTDVTSFSTEYSSDMGYDIRENLTLAMPSVESKVKEFRKGIRANQKLLVEFAAIHVGLTSNFNYYSEEALRGSLDSWLEPYPKPILKNHDPESEPIGRVVGASIDHEDGVPFVKIQAAISDPEAVEKLMDNRYLTGSVGGKAGEALCSVCNVNWAERVSPFELPCKHIKGKSYKEGVAYLKLGGLNWKEYSVVNVPADSSSRVLGMKSLESSEVYPSRVYALDTTKESVFLLSESDDLDILPLMEKEEARQLYASLKDAFLGTQTEEEQNIVADSKDQAIEAKEEESHEESAEDTQDEEDVLGAVESLRDVDSPEEESEESDSEEAEGEESEDSEGEDSAEDTADADSEEGDDSGEDSKEEDSQESAEVVELRQELTELKAELHSKNETISALQEETEDVKTQLDNVTSENIKLRKAIKEALAARVVDLKISLGYSKDNDREQLMSEHVSRTAQSLADSIKDLLNISQEKRSSAEMPKIDDVVMDDENAEEEEEGVDVDPQSYLVDVLMGRKKI